MWCMLESFLLLTSLKQPVNHLSLDYDISYAVCTKQCCTAGLLKCTTTHCCVRGFRKTGCLEQHKVKLISWIILLCNTNNIIQTAIIINIQWVFVYASQFLGSYSSGPQCTVLFTPSSTVMQAQFAIRDFQHTNVSLPCGVDIHEIPQNTPHCCHPFTMQALDKVELICVTLQLNKVCVPAEME